MRFVLYTSDEFRLDVALVIATCINPVGILSQTRDNTCESDATTVCKADTEEKAEALGVQANVDPSATVPTPPTTSRRRGASSSSNIAGISVHQQRLNELAAEAELALRAAELHKKVSRTKRFDAFFNDCVRLRDFSDITVDEDPRKLLLSAYQQGDYKSIKEAADKGAFRVLSMAELKSQMIHRQADNKVIDTIVGHYREAAARLLSKNPAEVTHDELSLYASFRTAYEEFVKEVNHKKNDYATNLLHYPGIGFRGAFTRLKEENWSLFNSDGTPNLAVLPKGVKPSYFSGIGWVLLNSDAHHFESDLNDRWAFDRRKFRAVRDERVGAQEDMKNRDNGIITSIFGIISKLLQQKLDFRSDSEGNYDYFHQLEYFKPFEGCELALNSDRLAEIHSRFCISKPYAQLHNDVIVDTRMRKDMSVQDFYTHWLYDASRSLHLPLTAYNNISDEGKFHE